MQLRWYDTLPDEIAAAWDTAWESADGHPFQHRVLAAGRAACHGQRQWYATGWDGGHLVFGAAVHARRSGPFPPRLAVTRGPWATDESLLTTGIRAMVDSPPAGIQPMSWRLDVHRPLPADAVDAALSDAGFAAVLPELHQQTIICDLEPSLEQALARFRTLTRRQLKKAASMGLQTTLGSTADIPTYLELHRRAAGLKGYGLPEADWLRVLLDSGLGSLFVSRSAGQLVGAGVFARGGQTVHYLYGATDPEFTGPALYDVFWAVWRHARAAGFRRFDLGGLPTEDDGIAFFKRGFGGEERQFSSERQCIVRPVTAATWDWLKRRLAR